MLFDLSAFLTGHYGLDKNVSTKRIIKKMYQPWIAHREWRRNLECRALKFASPSREPPASPVSPDSSRFPGSPGRGGSGPRRSACPGRLEPSRNPSAAQHRLLTPSRICQSAFRQSQLTLLELARGPWSPRTASSSPRWRCWGRWGHDERGGRGSRKGQNSMT